MAEENCSYEKKENCLGDMSRLIAEVERIKSELDKCNISCPPFEYPLEPCPEMPCDNNTYNFRCAPEVPPVSQQDVQLPLLPNELEFSKNFNHPSTSTSPDTCLAQNSPCDSAEVTHIHYPQLVPRPHWETPVIEILEDPDYTPRSNYYKYKCFRSHYPPNGI